MSNPNALNSFLKNVTKEEQLVAEYKKRCPDVVEFGSDSESDRDALDYCSGAAQFVLHFLTGNDAMHKAMAQTGSSQVALTTTNASALLAKIKGPGAMRIGYLASTKKYDHECVFAGAGNNWSFWQANRTGEAWQRWTLAPKLNPHERNWNVFDMSEAQFDEFFLGLNDSGRAVRLFRDPIDEWNVAAFSAGRNLLR